MRLPNFFIVGAQKCGTTTLYEYLRGHPSIFMCEPKEPEYFASDFPSFRYVSEWQDYTALFRGADGRHAAVGEASTIYIQSERAIPDLLARIPDARLIAMFRNPLDLAPSAHAQSLRDGDENVTNFEEAWDLCAERACGRQLPKSCRDNKILLYDQIGSLGFQLHRLLRVAPRQNVKWIFLEDMKRQPVETYQAVLAFLGVEDDSRTEFATANTRKTWRSPHLASLSRSVSRFTSRPPKRLFRAREKLGLQRLGIMGALDRFNTKPAVVHEVPAATRARMRETFRRDILLLQELTGRNLQHWLE